MTDDSGKEHWEAIIADFGSSHRSKEGEGTFTSLGEKDPDWPREEGAVTGMTYNPPERANYGDPGTQRDDLFGLAGVFLELKGSDELTKDFIHLARWEHTEWPESYKVALVKELLGEYSGSTTDKKLLSAMLNGEIEGGECDATQLLHEFNSSGEESDSDDKRGEVVLVNPGGLAGRITRYSPGYR